MSFQAMTWAISQDCKSPGQKLVLLMLANRTNNDTGRCDPSHSRLAKDCCMSVSAVKNHINALAEVGLIKVIRRKAEAVDLPNQYDLCMNGNAIKPANGGAYSDRGEADSDRGEADSDRGEADSDRGEGSESGYKTGSTKTGIKPVIETKARSRAQASPSMSCPPDVDDKVWRDYMAIRKAKRAPLTETALEGVKREAEIAGLSLNDALTLCCERNWQSLKAEWLKPKANAPYGRPQQLSIAEHNALACERAEKLIFGEDYE